MSMRINYIPGKYPATYEFSYNGLFRSMSKPEYESLVPYFYIDENPDPRSDYDWPKYFKQDTPNYIKYYLIKSLINEYESIDEYERLIERYKWNIEKLTKLNQELNDLD